MKTRLKSTIPRVNVRVVLGLVLVILSALGTWALVRSASASTPVVVASRLLVEGQQVQPGDIRQDEVGLAAFSGEYAASSDLVVGKVVTRVIHAGELVPRASIGEVSETLQTTMVIDVATDVASTLQEGSIIDVWAAQSANSSTISSVAVSAPTIVVSQARLAKRESAASAASGTSRVEVVLPRTAVPDLLSAIAAGNAMTVVASSGRYGS